MIHDQVKLIPWQPEWSEIYLQERDRIVTAMSAAGHRAEIFHVGSTSVKDMISKPIIDILVCPESSPEDCIADLEGIGYTNLGECGREGRCFLTCGDEDNHTFYVHLCKRDHQVAQDQLLFQRLERENRTIADKYRELKAELACVFPENRYMYRYLKGLYIEGVLSAYRKNSPSEDDDIRYWVFELEMAPEMGKKLERILDENEMTLDEYTEFGIRHMLDHPECIRKWAEENPDPKDIQVVREYPVRWGETQAMARKRQLAKETGQMKTEEGRAGDVG